MQMAYSSFYFNERPGSDQLEGRRMKSIEIDHGTYSAVKREEGLDVSKGNEIAPCLIHETNLPFSI